jgi:hypothetical protein
LSGKKNAKVVGRDKKGHLVKLIKNAPVIKPEKTVSKASLKRQKRRDHGANKQGGSGPIIKVFTQPKK